MAILLRHQQAAAFKRKAADLLGWLKQAAPRTYAGGRLRRQKVLRIGLEASIRWLEERKIMLRPFAVLNNLDKVPLALEQSFPGYVEAGLLDFALARAPRRRKA